MPMITPRAPARHRPALRCLELHAQLSAAQTGARALVPGRGFGLHSLSYYGQPLQCRYRPVRAGR